MKLIFHVPPFTLQSGCITKLENFIQEHLKIIGAVDAAGRARWYPDGGGG